MHKILFWTTLVILLFLILNGCMFQIENYDTTLGANPIARPAAQQGGIVKGANIFAPDSGFVFR